MNWWIVSSGVSSIVTLLMVVVVVKQSDKVSSLLFRCEELSDLLTIRADMITALQVENRNLQGSVDTLRARLVGTSSGSTSYVTSIEVAKHPSEEQKERQIAKDNALPLNVGRKIELN